MAEDNKGSFLVEAVDTILNNLYMDDLLKTVEREAHAIHLYQELKTLCAVGGFSLTKCSSNSRAVLARIPEKAKRVKDLDLEDLPRERTLCVHWCAKEDVFKFHVQCMIRRLNLSWDQDIPNSLIQQTTRPVE